jgi:hypothetical protein
VLFGQDKVAQGGWENMNFTLSQSYKNVFAKNHFGKFKSMLAFKYKFMGSVNLQIFNDDSSANTWNSGTHPTFALQWKGKVMDGMLKPMVQYLSYDNNHSNLMSFSTGIHMNAISGSAGVVLDTVNAKGVDSAGENEDHATKQTTFHVEAAYATAGFQPYFYYSSSSTETYGETADKETSGSSYDPTGSVTSVGLRFTGDKAITPFVTYNMIKGSVMAGTESVDSVDSTQLKLGFYTKIY